ncbi:MAG: hypothetical protein R3Y47_10915 [Lachnospiraceae bacterium]
MKEAKKKQDSKPEALLQVRVADFEQGVRIFDDVSLIRIKSKGYSLLIMADYFPVIGYVEGNVELVTTTEQINLGQVEGYYLQRNNELSLMIEKHLPEEKICD